MVDADIVDSEAGRSPSDDAWKATGCLSLNSMEENLREGTEEKQNIKTSLNEIGRART